MKVFLVGFDVNRFRSLALDGDQSSKVLHFDCTPRSADWSSPAMYCPDPVRPRPDLWYVGTSSTIAATADAFDKVQTQFEMAGECLPLAAEGERFTLLNVTECINCLDHDRSEFLKTADGRKLFPLKYAFHRDRFEENSIFKIPEARTRILCVERAQDPEMEFKAAVDTHRLKGLTFQQIWSSD
jgi:hypothetical protein